MTFQIITCLLNTISLEASLGVIRGLCINKANPPTPKTHPEGNHSSIFSFTTYPANSSLQGQHRETSTLTPLDNLETHVFGLREEAGVLVENPHRLWEKVQTPHREAWVGIEPTTLL